MLKDASAAASPTAKIGEQFMKRLAPKPVPPHQVEYEPTIKTCETKEKHQHRGEPAFTAPQNSGVGARKQVFVAALAIVTAEGA